MISIRVVDTEVKSAGRAGTLPSSVNLVVHRRTRKLQKVGDWATAAARLALSGRQQPPQSSLPQAVGRFRLKAEAL